METDVLTDRMVSEPNLSVRQSITIHIMVNFEGDGHGTCKQALRDFCL